VPPESAIEAAIAYLRSTQAGGWSATRTDSGGITRERDAFHSAIVAETLGRLGRARPALAHSLRGVVEDAAAWLAGFAAPAPAGAYRFWRDRGAADLDDTALVLLVRDLAGAPRPALPDLIELFGSWRVRANSADCDGWAAAFPGVFGTWMADRPKVVDAMVNHNVLRCLGRLGALEVPGVAAAQAMLRALAARPWQAAFAPYYELAGMRAFAALPAEALRALQAADGGWPAIRTCHELGGRPAWRSRAVATALALGTLATGRAGPFLIWKEQGSC